MVNGDARFSTSKRFLGLITMTQPNVNLEIKFTEVPVQLNVHEIGVILSALQELNLREENRIAREYGSVPALYNKLYSVFEQMDTSGTVLRNDVVPSF
jgi:hypothetical protein